MVFAGGVTYCVLSYLVSQYLFALTFFVFLVFSPAAIWLVIQDLRDKTKASKRRGVLPFMFGAVLIPFIAILVLLVLVGMGGVLSVFNTSK